MKPLLPMDFALPESLVSPQFLFRPLVIGDLIKDYDAVMTSVDRLRGLFGPDSDWPQPDLSLEQDLIDLGWHQKEFQRRSSFAYAVLTPDERQYLGCAYVLPSTIEGYDAEAYCWVRTSHQGLDPLLLAQFRSWLEVAWPFRRVALPGRDLPWSEQVRGVGI